MKLGSDEMVQYLLIAIVVALVLYLAYNYTQEDNMGEGEMANNAFVDTGGYAGVENFEGEGEGEEQFEDGEGEGEGEGDVMEGFQNVAPSESLGENEQPRGLGQAEGTQMNQLPAECYPKDVLSAPDLLPQDANSKYAQVAPSGQGSLQDKNFLTAGFHIGINTVGQSLRNANYQLRSDPTNPQVKVSPWNQTTIEPDVNRRPLEIGGN